MKLDIVPGGSCRSLGSRLSNHGKGSSFHRAAKGSEKSLHFENASGTCYKCFSILRLIYYIIALNQ
jgi:hypothetical protein